MIRLLTLAMSEMSPLKNEYKIIAYCYNDGEIYGFNINEKRFLDINGQVVWDIGAITQIEDVDFKDYKNIHRPILPKGDMALEKYISREELKSILEKQIVNMFEFKRNRNIMYSVIKVRTISSILKPFLEVKDDKEIFRTKIEFWANGEEYKLLNKDYRWINYWKYVFGKNDEYIGNRLLHYEEFFRNKEVYLILYRYHIKKQVTQFSTKNRINNNDVYWIAGIHYF